MVTIKYKNVILNGVDKSGKTDCLPESEATALVKNGFAEVIEDTHPGRVETSVVATPAIEPFEEIDEFDDPDKLMPIPNRINKTKKK